MKLSYLVSYRNYLEQQRQQLDTSYVFKELLPLIEFVKNHSIKIDSTALEHSADQVQTCIHEFRSNLDVLIDGLDHTISQKEPDYYQKSVALYERMQQNDSVEAILARRPKLGNVARRYVTARLLPRSDWHYPGMILRPAREDWIQHLVALDPLYIVDTDTALLDPARLRFNHLYQNRLRLYSVQDSAAGNLKHLPQAQMSLVLAYNFFNYKPFEITVRYLREIYNLLRPGGTVFFTINNCDQHGAVELVEKSYMVYTPWSRVRQEVESMGYQVLTVEMLDSAFCWIELQRPGELDSLRAGQALAKIVAR